MKKGFLFFVFFIAFFSANAQKNPNKKTTPVKKDTIKTEVVEVITQYNPKIADANKIEKKPTIQLLEKSRKKKLSYTIFSAPVASTFIPKSGVVKSVDVGIKERIYNNYIAVGFGNYTSPYIEAYLNNSNRYKSEFGLYTKYAASFDNVKNTVLDSNFSNFLTSLFFKKEERYFDWKINLNTELHKYNWYGLPDMNITETTLNTIDENQTYQSFSLLGEIDFLDAYINKSTIAATYFTDAFNNNEFLININTHLDLPIDFINVNLNNLTIKTGLEFLKGQFKFDYANENTLKYSIFTAQINPEYKTTLAGFSIKLGTKIFGSFDTEKSKNQFLIYPDIQVQKPIIKDVLNIYAGITGDLKTNTYKNFSKENPYISPTLLMNQTSEKNNIFVGFNGLINHNASFNISANIKKEENKPLFVRNNSKSNGTNNTSNGTILKGYEYGNSFNIIYDDVKTTSFSAELAYDFTNKISFATNILFNNFSLTNETEAWNLPSLQTSIIGKFKSNKWYATTTIFYVDQRKERSFDATYPSNSNATQTLKSFTDLNLNGGYHFNDKFSIFLKLNNILNNNYQRFANFNVQGFQALGGISYKFDF